MKFMDIGNKLSGIDMEIFELYSDEVKTMITDMIEKGFEIKGYVNLDFSNNQMVEILKGIEDGLDVSCYAKSYLTPAQMNRIRNELLK